MTSIKMFRRVAATLCLALLTSGAWGQSSLKLRGVAGGHPTVSNYTGPGDAVSGARAWYGLRGYNAAYATGSNPAICIGGSACTYNINILANGNVDIATALSDIGVGGTGSCTISGTTMICATGTGTLAQYSNITGAGLIYPAYITSVSCSSFPCTMTLNASQTVSVAETITDYRTIEVEEWYDQSGANACGGSPCNIGPNANRTNYLIANCFGSLPCVWWANISSNSNYNPATGMTSTNTPLTISAVGKRIGSFTTYGIILSTGSGDDNEAAWNNTTNTVYTYARSTQLNATAADSVLHAMQFVNNGASSVVNVDGTETTGTTGAGAADTSVYLGSDVSGNAMGNQYFAEAGLWPSARSSGDRTALCHNERLYWGTSGSC